MLHIGYLHFPNLEFLSADKLEVHAATSTQGEKIFDFEAGGALAASRPAWRLDNFEPRSFERGVLGADIEAKAHRVADYT